MVIPSFKPGLTLKQAFEVDEVMTNQNVLTAQHSPHFAGRLQILILVLCNKWKNTNTTHTHTHLLPGGHSLGCRVEG